MDGNTFSASDSTRARLIGIDSPERAQGPMDRHSTAALARLAPPGDTVQLEAYVQRTDRYGRLVARVRWRHTPVNESWWLAAGRCPLRSSPRCGMSIA